jgi:pimeloyl-ACP methyl ester carboxylesterase
MTSVQQVASHHWRVPARPFTVHTQDGVTIEGSRLGHPGADLPAIVLAHGLMGWHRKPKFASFAEQLTPWFTVFAPDMRGHGDSAGVSDFGGEDMWDVDAVLHLARRVGHDTVVTAGTSMGAIAVVRQGALLGGSDAVVAISSLAFWDWHGGADPKARRNFHARVGTVAGRAALRAWGVRLPEEWDAPESPEEVVGKIAPTPLVVVHGRDDPLFALDHAERLYEAAGEPKRLLIGEGFGHAEDGLTPAFARRLSGVIHEELGMPWSG